MKIAVVSHLLPNSANHAKGQFVLEQAAALQRLADVTLIHAVHPGVESIVHEAVDIPVVALPVEYPTWAPGRAATLLQLRPYQSALTQAVADIGGIDIVHGHFGYPDGVAAVRTSVAVGLPAAVTLHGSDANRQLGQPVVGSWIAGQLASADAVVCVSQTMLDRVSEAHPALGQVCEYIPNGYDDVDIRPRASSESEHILFVGGLDPVKRVDLVLEAYARVRADVGMGLVIAGDGPLRESLEAQVRDLGLSGDVVFLGRVAHSRVGELLGAAALLVMPSDREGLPVSAVEALATGTPVVATSVGGLPELVIPGENGELVATDDVEGLADAMARTVSRGFDPERVRDARPVMTWDDVAGRLMDVYGRVLRARGA